MSENVEIPPEEYESPLNQSNDEVDAFIDLDIPAPTGDTYKSYLQEIGRVPLLSAEEEVDLSKRIEAGQYAAHLLENRSEMPARFKRRIADLKEVSVEGTKAEKHMVEANLRLVVSIARRYQGKGMTLADLTSEGNLGLIRAMQKFDYKQGFKFSTYATWWVRQAITRAVADQGRTIRLPVHMVEEVNKLKRTTNELMVALGREPTVDEVSKVIGWKPARVKDIAEVSSMVPSSLESLVGEDSELEHFVQDADALAPDDQAIFSDMAERLNDALETLPARAALVLKMRFGIIDGKPRTLDEIGRHLGVTRERIRQIERDAISALRKPGVIGDLRSFISGD